MTIVSFHSVPKGVSRVQVTSIVKTLFKLIDDEKMKLLQAILIQDLSKVVALWDVPDVERIKDFMSKFNVPCDEVYGAETVL